MDDITNKFVNEAIDDVLRREGSAYVNDPVDRGGPTKYGITLAALSGYYARKGFEGEATVQAIEALTEDEARAIYLDLYVLRPGFDRIPERQVAGLLIDSGVNHGPARVIQWLQKIVGAPQDGILGPQTLAAYRAMNPREVFARLLQTRIEWYGQLTKKDPNQARFIHGWLRRATEFLEDLV